MKKRKVIVILGQTATGKSDLAIKISKKINGEVISADSRQVYKNLNIGTGKITKKEMRGIPHHLLDVVNPKNKFSVVEYQKLAISAMADIFKRNKIPIICGGTGFYIDAITKGNVFPTVPPNLKLRKNLESKSSDILLKILTKLDETRAKDILNKNEQNNKVRLIRAIEIAKALGKVPKNTEIKPMYKFVKIGLYLPTQELKKKINTRLEKRLKMGMINEIKKLHKKGLSWKKMYELGLEYRYISMYLQNQITKGEMILKLQSEIYHYAKRQMTWFKRDPQINWFDASKKIPLTKIV